jgi:hypothetical protein
MEIAEELARLAEGIQADDEENMANRKLHSQFYLQKGQRR